HFDKYFLHISDKSQITYPVIKRNLVSVVTKKGLFSETFVAGSGVEPETFGL
ncbi:MAG: hypothetical protein RI991_1051, partial [Bacteroidota bacterium]